MTPRPVPVVLAVLLVVAVVVAVGHARTPRKPKPHGGAVAAYWHAHANVNAALHREGVLGARVRSLTAENRRLRRQAAARTLQAHSGAEQTIRLVFGPHGAEAVSVALCETGDTLSPSAANGQYLGVFQMGSRERALYGHGPTVLEQALAAYRYFVAVGYSWRPWACKP